MSENRTTNIGLIGLGTMGYAMSKHLLAAGFPVLGYDISADALEAFSGLGGQVGESVSAIAAKADIVLTSLPSVAALDDVVRDLKRTARARLILAETSTFSLDDKIRVQRELVEAGIVMLDCPLSGSGSQAMERDVLVYGSGPRDAYDRCLPVFRGFSRAPHYLGAFGNGSKMKYIANLLVAIHTVAAGEAFTLARKAGLDPAQMFDVVSDGAGGSRAMQVRGPMLIANNYLPIRTMSLDLWRKDLRIITEYATALCCPTPLFSASVPLFNAAVASGHGAQDTAAVCMVLETMAGLNRG